MVTLLGYKSKSGVSKFVDRLIEHNILGKKDGKIYPVNLTPELRILGVVSAGFPSPSEEIDFDTMSLDTWMINDPDATYLLEVEGDSMINAGIQPGDYVVVERTDRIHLGDIVIAELDGEWTMKYLREKNGSRYLEPANESYPNLYPEETLNIYAKVTGVVRRYE
jgi:repressor LexA